MFRAILMLLAVVTLASAAERQGVKCLQDSPERRGLEGCTVLASRPFEGTVDAALYWHIDRFETLEAANQAAGPNGVATQSHGAVWLLTVEPRPEEHEGGQHIAWIGPLELPPASHYTLRVLSTVLDPGSSTPVHIHSGPEAWFIVSGEQCLQTEAAAHRLVTGQSFVLASDTVHQGRITASAPRHGFGLVLHDAARPGSRDLPDPPALVPCS